MKVLRQILLQSAASSLFLLAAGAVQAHAFKAGDIAIGHPWARPTVEGQRAGGGFMKLENKGKTDDRLLRASSEVAERMELHTMSVGSDNVMRMQEVKAIDIKAGQTVELKPGGLHVMFMGLKRPLKVDDRIKAELEFEKAGKVTVEFKVEIGSGKGGSTMGDGAHKH